jgi:hypothetical protein
MGLYHDGKEAGGSNMDGRRSAVRRFTQLVLAAGLVFAGGATAVRADPEDAWVEGLKQTVEHDRGRRQGRSDLERQRRRQRAEARRDREREVRRGLAERRRGRRIRRWREPDPPRIWRKHGRS